jgi:hypothetical protein
LQSALLSISSLSGLQLAKLHDRRAALAKKVSAYRDLQQTHMPRLERNADEEGDEGHPETFQLLLPSALPTERRAAACLNGAALGYEVELRKASAHQALDDVRRHLMMRTALYGHKRNNALSVAQSLKSQSAITSSAAQVTAAFNRYCRHWAVLDALFPFDPRAPPNAEEHAWRKDLQRLRREDLTGLNTNEAELQEQESIARAKDLAAMGGSGAASAADNSNSSDDDDAVDAGAVDGAGGRVDIFEDAYQLGQRRRKISWIWPHANLSQEAESSQQRLGEPCACSLIAALIPRAVDLKLSVASGRAPKHALLAGKKSCSCLSRRCAARWRFAPTKRTGGISSQTPRVVSWPTAPLFGRAAPRTLANTPPKNAACATRGQYDGATLSLRPKPLAWWSSVRSQASLLGCQLRYPVWNCAVTLEAVTLGVSTSRRLTVSFLFGFLSAS